MGRNHSYQHPAAVSLRIGLTLLALLLTAMSTACRHTRNSTGINIPPGWNVHPGDGGNGGGGNGTAVSITNVSATKPGGGVIHPGDQVVITTTFSGDIDPFTLAYVLDPACFDGTTIPTMPRTTNTSPDSFTATLLGTAPVGPCTVNVGIADSDGNTDVGSQTFQIVSAGGGPTNHDPSITAIPDDATCTIAVTVTDADGDDVSVTQAAPLGMLPLDTTQTISGGSGSFTFHYVPDDVIAGANGAVSFTADDGQGGSDNASANLFCPGVTLDADILYAIPTRASVAVGDPLTIVVAMGDPAQPFEYMSGVRLTVESASGFTYVSNSFNVGAEGGAADEADGFWSGMNPSNGFLLAPNSFYQVQDAGGGLSALDFNVTPLGGSDVDTGSGELFNFKATFTTPGTYTFGFQLTNQVDRTFYQDDTQTTNFYWNDITNSHAGVRNSVTVTP